MNQATLSDNLTLADVLALVKKDCLYSTNCHALGTVQSFDVSTQLAVVTINYKKVIGGKTIDYPPIVDCPVLILGGGTASLEFPISEGDTGLLCFNDRDMDTWISTGQTGKEPLSAALHSISDAIFICGVKPQTKTISDYSATLARFRLGTTKIELSDTVKIANQITDLKAILNGMLDLMTTLANDITTTGLPSGTKTTYIAQVNAYKTTIAGLLT